MNELPDDTVFFSLSLSLSVYVCVCVFWAMPPFDSSHILNYGIFLNWQIHFQIVSTHSLVSCHFKYVAGATVLQMDRRSLLGTLEDR